MGRKRWAKAGAALALLVLATLHAAPGQAADSTDFTGDVTDPTLASFTLTPPSADVTASAATFSVSLRVTDDLSGVASVNLGWTNNGQVSHHVNIALTSGDEQDGMWTGSFVVPRHSPAGDYEFHLSIADRVSNGRSFDADDLAAAGFPGRFTITDDDPDFTPPTVTGIRIAPTSVDVREGPQSMQFEVDVADSQSGANGMALFVFGPTTTSGGVKPPAMQLVAGTTQNGTWRGSTTVPRYTPQGRFRIELYLFDNLHNRRSLRTEDLDAAGLASGFNVTSESDLDAPRLLSASIEPAEVNVHDADQEITVRVRVTDDLAGVEQFWPDMNLHNIQVSADDLVTQQGSGIGGMARESGSALDGMYATTFTVPKSSATGLRPVRISTTDAVANYRYVGGDDLVAVGGIPALLVYNVPLPPIVLGVEPGDTTATIRWDPPTDDRGAEVTEYVVHESPDGMVERLDGDERAAVIDGLRNDISHTFTVTAVNKAGPSDPSMPVSATPRVVEDSPSPTTSTTTTTTTTTAPPTTSTTTTSTTTSTTTAPPPTTTTAPPPTTTTTTTVPPATTSTTTAMVPPTTTTTTIFVGPPAPVPTEPPTVPSAPTRAGSGYWMSGTAGAVYAFGDAPWLGNAPVGATPAVDIEATPSGRGYWVVDARGQVFAFGDAPHLGGGVWLEPGETVTAFSRTPSGRGYWTFTSRGRAFPFGDARHFGDLGALRLNGPVLDSVATPSGNGYYLVASDGGVFAFGDARFAGSMGHVRLNAPVQSLVPDPDGRGYWLVASDGGIFAFDARFHGSMGGTRLNRPVTGMVGSPTGGGYLMVAEDGGIFAFGDVRFHGSLGGRAVPAPITAVAATSG